MKKFRPQSSLKRYNFLRRIHSEPCHNHNWQERRPTGPFEFGYIFGHIHYLTAHAPETIRARYKNADKIWWDKMRWHKSGASRKL